MPESLDHFKRIHGEPSFSTPLPPIKRGARGGMEPPPMPPRPDGSVGFPCGIVVEIVLGGLYREIKPCRDASHLRATARS